MTELTYLELFAGVGGMSLAFDRAGFRCVGHAEIEPFPRRVLKHRWPDVPLFGDVCELRGDQMEHPTIVTFGAPCQDLSVAGKRAGLAGSRSSLFYEGLRLWNETQAPYALYENVLGALSSNKGGDFALVLSAFVGSPVNVPKDGWRGGGGVVTGRAGVAAWRVLDAQFFGVPQRRRRVFVLGARAGGVDPAEVLSLAEGLSGDTPQGREAGEGTAEAIASCLRSGGIGGAPSSRGENIVLAPVETVDTTLPRDHLTRITDYTPVVMAVDKQSGQPESGSVAPTLKTDLSHDMGPILFTKQQYGKYEEAPRVDATLGARDHASQNVDLLASRIGRPRRLTPLECERLMGWPDGWTGVPDEKGKPASDSVRYRACGNGVATPVAHWIALRLRQAIEEVR